MSIYSLTKTCSKCGQDKPLSEYNKHKTNTDGLSGHCKECYRQYQKEWKSKNKNNPQPKYTKGYYVYAYLREDYTPYYIGKGKDNRAWAKHLCTKPPRDSNRIIILHDNLSEIYAFILERYYIRWHGRKDNNTGILRNLTDGGDGTSGYKHTEEHRTKISQINKGRIGVWKDKKLPEETKTKISQTRKGQKGNFTGNNHSKETRERIKNTLNNVKSPCPYCGMMVNAAVMNRWHGIRCKQYVSVNTIGCV